MQEIEASHSHDWKFISHEQNKRTWFYKDNVGLKIESNHDDICSADIHEDWLEKYGTHSMSTSKYFNIYFQGTIIARIPLINMDGGNVDFPYPNLKDKTVDEFEYKISELVSRENPKKYLEDNEFSIAPYFSLHRIIVDTGFTSEDEEESPAVMEVKMRKHY